MKENDEVALHAGIVSKSQKIPEFRPILEFATDTLPAPQFRHFFFLALSEVLEQLL